MKNLFIFLVSVCAGLLVLGPSCKDRKAEELQQWRIWYVQDSIRLEHSILMIAMQDQLKQLKEKNAEIERKVRRGRKEHSAAQEGGAK